jgi:Rrf2 family protein
MKITVKSEYACLAMIELAANYRSGQPIRLKAIAEKHGIDSRFLVQALQGLKTAGLVLSARGAYGGYSLPRPPEEISLADILNATEDPTQKQPSPRPGPLSAASRLLMTVWKEIQSEVQRQLRTVTLADLLHRTEPSAELTYQI